MKHFSSKFRDFGINSLNSNFCLNFQKYFLLEISFIPKKVLRKKEDSEDEKEKDNLSLIEKDIKLSRMHQVDATIVRLMKEYKTLLENDIVTAAFKMVTQFRVNAKMIKESIKRLVEKEYLGVSRYNKKLYIYKP